MPSSARKVTAPPAARTPAASLDEAELLTIIGYQLAQAAVVTDRVFAEQVGGPQELRRLEFTLLALLNGNPGSTARQLARALAVTPPHIAAAVERLAQRGWLERERGERDARLQHLTLSRAGVAAMERAIPALQRGEAEALAALSSAERAMLAELLHKAARSRRT
ncbi:MAG: MarR family transcriptional regulator [Proteobacteria bacterium]|jgi:DNA-binding MarR family transcriptional regulator|nr:MarR family transcriptional regulator [Pseudomonadota bacterium]